VGRGEGAVAVLVDVEVGAVCEMGWVCDLSASRAGIERSWELFFSDIGERVGEGGFGQGKTLLNDVDDVVIVAVVPEA
jgi:hypothetical protein